MRKLPESKREPASHHDARRGRNRRSVSFRFIPFHSVAARASRRVFPQRSTAARNIPVSSNGVVPFHLEERMACARSIRSPAWFAALPFS
ncbi:hypothetical protein [Burkholderia sp. Bp9031]|uniref:hypothetical protein n=1 Tax=Burkholderia sp. Bp9031 TaxID=2184566 RepID=UPI000F5D4F2B|nr:hypothetical protein [Burkholderia sp. Bp9031]